jgi:hypothetical protein
VIFYCVVSSSEEIRANLAPLVADNFVTLKLGNSNYQEKNPLFSLVPGVFFNFRVQVVVPSFSTLLAFSAFDLLCDL